MNLMKTQNKKTNTAKSGSDRKIPVIFLLLLAVCSFFPADNAYAATYAGNALDFDGGNGYVDCGTGPNLSGATLRTVEAWAYTRTSNNGAIFSSGDTSGTLKDFSFRTLNGKPEMWRIQLKDKDTDVKLTGCLNSWHHYALVYDGTMVKLYYDGVLQTSPVVTLATAPNKNFLIGQWNGYSSFDGMIDELRVWNTARTQDQISSARFSRLSGNEDNLVAYYRFDETAGTSLTDYQKSHLNNGTLKNMTSSDWVSSGAPLVPPNIAADNYTLMFDGSGSTYVEINGAKGSDLSFTKNFTLSAWIAPADVGSLRGIITKVSSNSEKQYALSIYTGGRLQFDYEKGDNNFLIQSPADSIKVNKWQHVAVTVDSERMVRLYIDGVQVASQTAPAETAEDGTPIIIGRWGGTFNRYGFSGLIDEVCFWNKALTVNEINSVKSLLLGGDEDGLKANYRMDQSSGSAVPDLTPKKLNGTLTSPYVAWYTSDLKLYKFFTFDVTIRKSPTDLLGDGIPSDFPLDGLNFSHPEGANRAGGTVKIFAPELILDQINKCYYQLVGWQGSGSLPNSGVGLPKTDGVFIDRDTSIKWIYRKVYQLTLSLDQPPDAASFPAAAVRQSMYVIAGSGAPMLYNIPIFFPPNASITLTTVLEAGDAVNSYRCTGYSTDIALIGAYAEDAENTKKLYFTMGANARINWIYREADSYGSGKAITAPTGISQGWDYTKNIKMIGTYSADTVENSFYWDARNNKLYAVKPAPYFEISWDDPAKTVTRGYADWPAADQRTVVGAPVNLAPAKATRKFEELSYSECYTDENGQFLPPTGLTADRPSDSTPIFQPSKTGKSTFRFTDTASGNPVFLTVEAALIDKTKISQKTCNIGTAVTDARHKDPEKKNGFVVNEKAYYDGYGNNKAYDRDTRTGPIIPVNKSPADTGSDRHLIIAWYATDTAGIAWALPDYATLYMAGWLPDETIVIASQNGSSALPSYQYAGMIYYQDNPELPGFNPNEEHALLLNNKVYAIRNDLNTVSGVTTSEPYVLLKYRNPDTKEWNMRVFKVIAEDAATNLTFRYNLTVGNPILPLMPFQTFPIAVSPESYTTETGYDWHYKDHKGVHWAKAAAVGTETQAQIVMKWYYPMQSGFYYPDYDKDGQPDAVEGQDVAFLNGGQNNTDPPKDVTYVISWPQDVPVLNIGETLTDAKYGLPDIVNWASGEIIYDENVHKQGGPLAKLYDPYSPRSVDLAKLPDDIRTESKAGKIWFTDLPYAIRMRLYYDSAAKKLCFFGLSINTGLGDPLILPNVMSIDESARINALSAKWNGIINTLFDITRNPNRITFETVPNPYRKGDAYTFSGSDFARFWGITLGLRSVNGSVLPQRIMGLPMALTAGMAQGKGWLVLAENDDDSLGAAPVRLHVIRVDQGPYQGEIKVIKSDNVFDEKLTLRHSGDFGGEPERLYFEWYYKPDQSGFAPSLPQGTDNTGWTLHSKGAGLNQITLEGAGLLTLTDNWFMVHYYYGDQPGDKYGVTYPGLITANEVALGPTYWSKWGGAPGNQTAQLAEGWVKRVLSDLNPLDARVTDFYNYPAGTVVDVISQLGKKYEGDIAYNGAPENLNSLGLIEAYQTIRNNTLKFGPDAKIDNGGVNNSILLVSTKLAYFYALLGNEAYIDAQDPTIGFDTKSGELGYMASSVFAFQNQVASLLDEELVLLRGRDDSTGTTRARPVYNRFIWNFTNGEGELAYVQTYNITDQDVSGVVDEKDAMILYPQGHGDAWGHYLTAMTTWYDLLRHPYFTWEPRSESVLVAGAPVSVDYFDERKFAQTAASKAKVGMDIVNLTYRSKYVTDPAGQWQGYRDTDKTRAWGVDEWERRVGQGMYFDWVTASALVPATDPDPGHTGIQKIDRTTIPELQQIASENQMLQIKADEVDQGLNPLGLAQGVVPFDVDPHIVTADDPDIDQSTSHFEQIWNRAKQLLSNAAVIFDYATQYTLRLRGNRDTLTEFTRGVQEQENEYTNQLIGLFGYPYYGDIGPGGTYVSGYDGPDLFHYMYVNLPELTGDTIFTGDQNVAWTVNFDYQKTDGANYLLDDINFGDNGDVKYKKIFEENCDPSSGKCTGTVRYYLNEDNPWLNAKPEWGSRRAPGEIQSKLSELIQANADYERALRELESIVGEISAAVKTLEARYNVLAHEISVLNSRNQKITSLDTSINALTTTQIALTGTVEIGRLLTGALADALPDVVGFSNDITGAARSAIEVSSLATVLAEIAAMSMDIPKEWMSASKDHTSLDAEYRLFIDDARFEVKQMILELETMESGARVKLAEMYGLMGAIRQSAGEYRSLVAQGERLLVERETFRKRTAGIIQDYRYQDIAFRLFRNSAVEKYQVAFELAARYTYMAAAAFDYETTMLAPDSQMGAEFFASIIRQQSVGTVIDGEPVAGETGLSVPLLQLWQSFQMYKGQLGINNPIGEMNTFSLKRELFRIDDPNNWKTELNKYKQADILQYPPFKQYCRTNYITKSEPGLVIPFSTEINHLYNFFGWPLGADDGTYDPSSYATKIRAASVLFENYQNAGLTSTPRVYLIPIGADVLRVADAQGDLTRQWRVVDQKLPVPLNISLSDLEMNQKRLIINLVSDYGNYRKFSAMRAYPDTGDFSPYEYNMNSRLIGRSVWNTQWVLIIPGGNLLYDADEGLKRFIENVTDIKLVYQTYSYSGN